MGEVYGPSMDQLEWNGGYEVKVMAEPLGSVSE